MKQPNKQANTEAGKLMMITREYSVEINVINMLISPAKFSPNTVAGRVVSHTNIIAPAIKVIRIIFRDASNSTITTPHSRLADKTNK
jgi:hypothetical protein